MAKSKISTKQETKNNIFEHSQAKLDFYRNYLWRYLSVLLNDKYTTKINLYDVFCGIGIYEDGGKGSPIIAVETIKNLSSKYSNKQISLTINDVDISKVETVKKYINANYKDICELNYYNINAIDMLKLVRERIAKSPKSEKNLVFIDPYGYKEIYRQDIIGIMSAGKSEIILFLPISNMYRFSKAALIDEDNASYAHLQRFILDFFEDNNHPIYEGKFEHQLEYIDFIKNALSLNEAYYSASYIIQRHTNNYYALFFITSHIYGLHHIIETKWKLDDTTGAGFLQTQDTHLLSELYEIEKKDNRIFQFEIALKIFLADFKSNNEIYEFSLKNGFLPSHANKILESNRSILMFDRAIKPRKESFLLGHDHWKTKIIRYKVKIDEPKK